MNVAARPVLQRLVQDVGRVGPHVGPEVVEARGVAQLGEVLLDLPLLVAPREVRVRLREADLREPLHHRGAGERLGEEDHVGIRGTDLTRSATPRTRTASCAGCRPGTRARRARSRTGRRRAARPTAPVAVLGVEVDRVDVLVALRRVLGVRDRAVGSVPEPLRVLGDPRVVGRGLEREVERDLDAEVRAAATSRSKSATVPSSGCTAVWPPAAAPIAHGLPGSAGRAVVTLFGPLRCVVPIGWIGGRYSTSKPIAATYGSRSTTSRERARSLRVGGRGAREQLVPR